MICPGLSIIDFTSSTLIKVEALLISLMVFLLYVSFFFLSKKCCIFPSKRLVSLSPVCFHLTHLLSVMSSGWLVFLIPVVYLVPTYSLLFNVFTRRVKKAWKTFFTSHTNTSTLKVVLEKWKDLSEAPRKKYCLSQCHSLNASKKKNSLPTNGGAYFGKVFVFFYCLSVVFLVHFVFLVFFGLRSRLGEFRVRKQW